MSVELIEGSSNKDENQDFQRSGSSHDSWEGDGKGECHLESSGCSISKGFVESTESLRDPNEEVIAVVLVGLCVTANVDEGVLDVGFGPESIDQEVILVGEHNNEQGEPEAGPFESSDVAHDAAHTDNGGNCDTDCSKILLQAVGQVDVVAGGVDVDCVHDAEESFKQDPDHCEYPVVALVFSVFSHYSSRWWFVIHVN